MKKTLALLERPSESELPEDPLPGQRDKRAFLIFFQKYLIFLQNLW
jgi:hypothetical protein